MVTTRGVRGLRRADIEETSVSESAQNAEAPEKSELELMKEAAEQRKPYVLKLKYPIKFGSETISELLVNRPTVADMRRFQVGVAPSYGDYIDVAARMCKRDAAVLNQLDIEDGNRLVMVAGFLSGLGLATGGR